MERGAKPEQLFALTGIRSIAAIWVVLFHLRDQLAACCPFFDWAQPVVQQGYRAVPFFFLLSGFVLTHGYFPSYRLSEHGRFLGLRFARLWPLHVGALAALLLFGAIRFFRGQGQGTDFFPSWSLIPELAMVRAWFSEQFLWNQPAWSIHCEWFAYAFLFPVCFFLFARPWTGWLLTVSVGSLLAAACVFPHWTPGRLDEIGFLFLSGSALRRLRDFIPARFGPLLVWTAIGLFFGACWSRNDSLFVLAYASATLGLSWPNSWLASALGTPLFVRGGETSYALYMIHHPVMVFLLPIVHLVDATEVIARYVLFAMLLVAIGLVAWAAHRWIEVPCNRWIRARLDTKPTVIFSNRPVTADA